ncbi:thioredoxin domain-containing protein [Candidatus Saccharibacteria bacterium]|nr:thioredoxin domain-containing protein [Candidatus Saccharibacteria bacterium]
MKKGMIIGTLIVVAVVGIICLANFRTDPYANMNPDSIIEPSETTGFIGEKTVGNPDDAKIVIYEYADFGCSHCADWNRKINNFIEKYDGKIALIFRSYDIGQFKNSLKAASAATAAQIQGYFKEYKDLLYSNQSEWFYEDGADLTEILSNYFEEASKGTGDLDKFKEDIKSDSVRTRLKFEQNMGKKVDLAGTPTFRIDGETISLSELIDTIEKKTSE